MGLYETDVIRFQEDSLWEATCTKSHGGYQRIETSMLLIRLRDGGKFMMQISVIITIINNVIIICEYHILSRY